MITEKYTSRTVQLKYSVTGFGIVSGDKRTIEVWGRDETAARWAASDYLYPIDTIEKVQSGLVAKIEPQTTMVIDFSLCPDPRSA